MKKGISIWSFTDQQDLKKCFEIAKDAGFDGVEVALDELIKIVPVMDETSTIENQDLKTLKIKQVLFYFNILKNDILIRECHYIFITQ